MSEATDEFEIRKLLGLLKQYLRLTWDELGREIDYDATILRRVSHGKVKPPPVLRDVLVMFCRNKGYSLNSQLLSNYRSVERSDSADSLQPGNLVTADAATKAVIARVGIDKSDIDRTIQQFAGMYLHLLLDEDNKVIVTHCHLSRHQDPDLGVPVFSTWRRLAPNRRRRIIGNYYTNDRQLILLGSRREFQDIRLAIFKLDEEASPLMGIATGVSWANTIFSSRCVLVRRNPRIKNLVGPRSAQEIGQYFPSEVVDYLFQEDKSGLYLILPKE